MQILTGPVLLSLDFEYRSPVETLAPVRRDVCSYRVNNTTAGILHIVCCRFYRCRGNISFCVQLTSISNLQWETIKQISMLDFSISFPITCKNWSVLDLRRHSRAVLWLLVIIYPWSVESVKLHSSTRCVSLVVGDSDYAFDHDWPWGWGSPDLSSEAVNCVLGEAIYKWNETLNEVFLYVFSRYSSTIESEKT